MPKISDIAAAIPNASLIGNGDVVVSGITHDSREVGKGDLFAVLSGSQTDGHLYIQDAVQRGALAFLSNSALDVELPQIIVEDPRRELGTAAAAVYGRPTQQLMVAGITGTNGKTTTAYLTEAALIQAGFCPGVMSTVEYRIGNNQWAAKHTTPEATVVQSTARTMLDKGASHLVMEASSHGLVLGRLSGCDFDVVAFTNLTQDHLDFHGTMEEYGAAKLLLFTEAIRDLPDARVVVNYDDPFSKTIEEKTSHPITRVSCRPNDEVEIAPVEPPSFTIRGIEAQLRYRNQVIPFSSPLLGAHNLQNLLVAFGIALNFGIEPNLAARGLGQVKSIPGRLERIDNSTGTAVLVDYAHTPDALKRALEALRPLTKGRLITVFGCGGDRDPIKRPLMGKAVGSASDIAIITSDNPRTENPDEIIKMIVPGVEESGSPPLDGKRLKTANSGFVVVGDRRQAIEDAIALARPSDTVLIAGKGHEDYQILGTRKVHFDDREEARRALERKGDFHG